ncbi:MAG: hypothetical protein ABI912_02090 [Actinomycetota bacterium]
MTGHAMLEDLRRVEAPDGRFWTVQYRPGLLAIIVEASTEALPRENYRWRVAGLMHGRSAALQVARALRQGVDATPANGTLVRHDVEARVLPLTGNVNLVPVQLKSPLPSALRPVAGTSADARSRPIR